MLIRCTAPDEVLHERILDRQSEGKDASEANFDVLESQLEAIDDEGFQLLDVDTTHDNALEETLARIKPSTGAYNTIS